MLCGVGKLIMLCKCGCGKEVKAYRKGFRNFVYGHSRKNTHIQKINIIKCSCGCDKELNEFDKRNRIRKYIPGHGLEGKHMSEETKRKIGLKNSQRIRRPEEIERLRNLAKQRIGKPLSEAHKLKISLTESGKIAWNKNKTGIYSKELLLKKSKALSGKNNPRWKGGIQYEPYDNKFKLSFKEFIRKRDGYKCVLCSMPQSELKRKLAIHHIDGNKKNTHQNNCVSLCNRCHNKIHVSNKYVQLILIFQRLLDSRLEVNSH